MAEFFDVMKQVRRMCASISCNNCILPRWSDEMCIWEDAPWGFTDEVIAEIEAKTLKWDAEHPELRYPTWQEWNDLNFPDYITPCGFMPKKKVEALTGKKGQSQILCKLQMRHEQSRIIHCARQRIYPTAALCAV